MSIIHDALKKIQQTNPGKAPENTQPTAVPAIDPALKAPERSNIPLWVAALCAALAMVFAALPALAPKKEVASVKAAEPAPLAKTIPQTASLAQAVSGAVAVPVVPRPTATTEPADQPAMEEINPADPLSNIRIEGVIDMGGKKAVLINGNVYEEGQTIRGKIISEVSFETLTILDNGQKRTFPVKP